MSEQRVRHILSLSGGKDSTALAIHMRDRVAEMEYVFCDTGEELKETYEYLDKVEAYLGKPIVRLKNSRHGFADLLEARRGFLPSPQARWCTQYLKIKPFEDYVGDDHVYSYIAIRADEPQRKGYISTKPNIAPVYPFIEDGIVKDDVYQLLVDSGLGLPEYYKWRSRSGCYFCFFQQRQEWVGLLENHPDLFQKAMAFEKVDAITGERYTWNGKESLLELANPERIEQIKEEARRREANRTNRKNNRLLQLLDDDNDDQSCLICHL
jgi:3'-phosphoadenosine 5'-phosphosulfate sulfotransferase (PAPS reductase)/FAD synthetase